MKRIDLILMLTVVVLAAACSDKDEVVTDNLSKYVIGNYEGYTSASSAYFSGMLNAGQQMTVAEGTSDNKVNIRYNSPTWGTITATDATILKNEGGFVITGTGVWSMGHNGSVSDYDCTVTGNVKSGETKFVFSSPSVMGGLTVEFMEGEIPASLVLPDVYKGWIEASCGYFEGMTAENQEITISDKDNVYSLYYESDTWGTFAIEDIKFIYAEGKFSISGDGKCRMGMNGNLTDYPCTLSGSIDVEKSNPTFCLNVPAVMGGLSITFRQGEIPTETTNE